MSVQLDTYLASRARGDSVERACELSTIGHAEALLHEEDIASGALELPHVHVHVHARERINRKRRRSWHAITRN